LQLVGDTSIYFGGQLHRISVLMLNWVPAIVSCWLSVLVTGLAGTHCEPFHCNTWPEVAPFCAILDGEMEPGCKSAAVMEPSAISEEPTAPGAI